MENKYNMLENICDKKEYDAIIIGGGTAGLFCAYEASKKGLKVALIEHNEKLGAKLVLAGGGMGNMTNRFMSTEHYVGSDNKEMKKLLSSLFKSFKCEEVIELLNLFQISFEERDFGQIFCLNPVKKFIGCLEKGCKSVEFFLGERLQRIYYDEINIEVDDSSKKEKQYHVVLNNSHIFSKSLVIATGSTAYPQIGASDFGLRLAKKWGHDVHEFSSVLVPFVMDTAHVSTASTSVSSASKTFNLVASQHKNTWNLSGLEGISIPVRISVLHGKTQYRDPCDIRPMLFTHKGLSGPAVLVASCFWTEGEGLIIDFLPKFCLHDAMHNPENGKKNVKNILLPLLPDRLVYRLIPEDLQKRKVAEISKKDRQRLISLIHEFLCFPQRTEGLKKAEAARGGVSVKNLKHTLESSLHEGLYFCGELIDITGLLGGYNIHFALASAKRVAHSLQIH